MAKKKQPPVLLQPVPDQVFNEGQTVPTLNLNHYVESPEGCGPVQFKMELVDGTPLPEGLVCTLEGELTGTPAPGTAGAYVVLVLAENESNEALPVGFNITIEPPAEIVDFNQYFTDLKSKVWKAVEQDLPVPDLQELMARPISATEIHYFLERFATLMIWDIYNLEPPGELIKLDLPGASKHFNVFDRGSYIVAGPKDLFSHDRNLEDALQTARAMAAEVAGRNWTVELIGFNKMVRATWIELQILGHTQGKTIEVMHFTPRPQDTKIYEAAVDAIRFGLKKV